MRILEFNIENGGINPQRIEGGHAGEHFASEIKINVPKEFYSDEFNFRLEFLSNINQRTFTNDLSLVNGEISFKIPQGLMVEGELKCQLTIFKRFTDTATQIIKSYPFIISIAASVMANPVAGHPFYGLLSAQLEEFLNMARLGSADALFNMAVRNGFTGTEAEFLASLRGAAGPAGEPGPAIESGSDFKVTRVESGANVKLNDYTEEGRYIFPGLTPAPDELFGARFGLILDVFSFGARILQIAHFTCIEMGDSVDVSRSMERVRGAGGNWSAWRARALVSHTNMAFPNNIVPDSAAPGFSFNRNIGSTVNRYHNIFLQNAPNVSSDIRLKDDVHVVCLDKLSEETCEYETERDFDHKDIADFINAIDIITFKFKNDECSERNIGLIANQLEEINPHLADLLVTEGDDGTLGVKSADLIYPLIAAYQFQAMQAADLTQRVNMLEIETQNPKRLDDGIQ